MSPQDRLPVIAGILLVSIAVFAIVGFPNTGQVVGDAVITPSESELSPPSTELFDEKSTMSFFPNNLQTMNEKKEWLDLQAGLLREQPSAYYLFLDKIYNYKNEFRGELSAYVPRKISLSEYYLGTHVIEHFEEEKNPTLEVEWRAVSPSEWESYPIYTTHGWKKYSPLDYDGYLYEGKIWVETSRTPSKRSGNLQRKSSTTNELFLSFRAAATQPVPVELPFNQKPRKAIVLVIHKSTNTLPSNWQNKVSGMMDEVRAFYLANSDRKFDVTYDALDVVWDNPFSWDPAIQFSVLTSIDPSVDFTPYDFAVYLLADPGAYLGGNGGFVIDSSGNPVYFPTNEPMETAYAILGVDLTQPNPPGLRGSESAIIHEIGHTLPFWNPEIISHTFPFSPHAQGIPPFTTPNVCFPHGNETLCRYAEYGNYLDMMGIGRGLFSYHNASTRVGLENKESVFTTTSSGWYSICDMQHDIPDGENCVHELLLNNPDGADVSIEMRNPIWPDDYWVTYGQCDPAYFDGVLFSIANPEQGGIGSTRFVPEYGFVDGYGDIAMQISPTSNDCPGIPDFTVGVGEMMNTPLGDVHVNAITSTSNGGKKATVYVNYQAPGPVPLCTHPTDGQIITESTTFCSGTYFIPNGITVFADEPGELISVACDGTEIIGNGNFNSIGVTIRSIQADNEVHLRNCGINNYAAGIFVKDPVDYQITGNIIGNNYWGIVVSPTQPVSGTHTHLTTISENHITTSHNGFVYAGWGTGIYVKEDQDNGWILSNVIYSGKNGVVVKDTDWTRIGSNRIYGTFTPGYGGDGIFSSNTDNLDISTNDVEGYATNVQLGAGSTGSRFYSNNFAFSQGINAIDLGMNNEWYNTYYTMGNYWSDHVCVDNVQPIGICDNPKTIYTQGGALVQDLYPRKTPI